MCQCSRSNPLVPIQLLYSSQPLTPTQHVPFSPLSQTPIKQLQPTQILASLQPVPLSPISTLPEKDDPEPEQQELEPEQHEPDYGRNKLTQQFKSCMGDFNENVLNWRTEYMSEKYKTSFKKSCFARPSPTQIINPVIEITPTLFKPAI